MDEELNGLFLKWLTEWRDQAKCRGNNMQYVFGKAITSLRSHPQKLTTVNECAKLKHFGPKICQKIEKRYAEHKGIPYVKENNSKTQPSNKNDLLSSQESTSSRQAKQTNRRYIPSPGSSSFAILVSLLRHEFEFSNSKVNKFDLRDMAQHYLNDSTSSASLMSLNTLVDKELIDKTQDRNTKYFLTDSGRRLAQSLAIECPKLKEFSERFLNSIPSTQNDVECWDSLSGSSRSQSRNFILTPGSYEVILCVDTRERYSNNQGTQNRSAFAAALQKKGIKLEIRTLPLGDFVWIARQKNSNVDHFATSVQINRELVLDYIIERKRIDDLAQSIRDHRWDEQRFRLRQCALRKPIYLIEYMGKQSRKQDFGFMPSSTLDQAICNCEIDGFETKITDSFEETVRYLTNMSKWLEHFYSDKSIMSVPSREHLTRTCAQDLCYITFNEFVTNAEKIHVFTVKEMFIKHLLQIKGLSLAKIQNIINKYPTLKALMEAYRLCKDDKQRENLLADTKCDSVLNSKRRLGKVISKKIYQFYANY